MKNGGGHSLHAIHENTTRTWREAGAGTHIAPATARVLLRGCGLGRGPAGSIAGRDRTSGGAVAFSFELRRLFSLDSISILLPTPDTRGAERCKVGIPTFYRLAERSKTVSRVMPSSVSTFETASACTPDQ